MIIIKNILKRFTSLVILSLLLASCSNIQTDIFLPPIIEGEDLRNGNAALIDFKLSKRPTAIVFLSSKCPCSNSHIDLIAKLARQNSAIQFIGIHSNQDEEIEPARAYFKSLALPFPVIRDENAKIADFFKAFKTPHAYLLDAQMQQVYQGGVTDCAEANKSKRQYLEEAIEDLLNNRPIKTPEGRTLGCFIKRTQ